MWSVSFSPLVSDWLFVALAFAAAVAAVAAIVFKRAVGFLRALALAACVIALADPSLRREDRDPIKDVVAIVVDRSASNRIAGRAEQTQRALDELKRRIDSMPGLEARVVEVNDVDGGEDDGTRLFAGLQNGLSDVAANRVAGAIMITDGVVHDIPLNAGDLSFKAPLHALITGRPNERDRRIELVEAPKFGMVGREQAIRLRVLDTTQNAGAPARLKVLRDGAPLADMNVAIGQTVRVPIRIEHGGANVIELEVAPIPNELTDANNRAVVTIEGVREKLRVLLVSGEPHPGERTWRNLLKSDANVELVHFTILRPPEKQDGTPINELSLIAFPTRELFGEKIKEFDLIIFDRYANQSILPRLYFENIVRYVRQGGAVMVAAGPEFAGNASLAMTPLAQVLPARPDGRVIEEPYLARITTVGRRHPVTRNLPGGETEPPTWAEWLRLVSANAQNGATVMDGPQDRPVMVLSREDKGRVAVILSDHAWLWARNFRSGGPYLEMLRRVSHWLMKEPQLEEEALRGSARGRVITIERQTMADAAAPVIVSTPSGQRRTVELKEQQPGLFTATMETDEIGLHRIADDKLTAFVGVGPENPREWRNVVSTTELLQPIADATGGSVRRLVERGDALRLPNLVMMRAATRYGSGDSIGLRANDQSVVRGVSVWPVFVGLAGLLLLASLLIGAWLGEGGRFGRRDGAGA
ncbi:MAG: hypothetical protein BGP06_03285 [Rhizobiales bacterium 65-9]|nr:hypothetical protein [Hyphomicrobiales bacterium]OJY35877.1 MAG: hypothetical protein BGP06_03285 [Rhizobiales bacterium 65-9]